VAQTRKRRRRKHRGTPAGTIERAGRTGRPQTREDAKKITRQRRAERMSRTPTWRGAVNRAAIAALLFGALLIALGRGPAQAAVLTVFVFCLYVPLGYGTDVAIYRFRQRRQAGRTK
jgi:hypothetical protein